MFMDIIIMCSRRMGPMLGLTTRVNEYNSFIRTGWMDRTISDKNICAYYVVIYVFG